MSIDELLGLSVEELEALSDEQLLTRYAPIFQLEPAVPLDSATEADESEDTGEGLAQPKIRKIKKSTTKIADLKKKLMEASKAGLSADDLFEKDFG